MRKQWAKRKEKEVFCSSMVNVESIRSISKGMSQCCGKPSLNLKSLSDFNTLLTFGHCLRMEIQDEIDFRFLSEVPNFYEFLNMLQFNLTIALDWVRNVKLIIFRIFTQLRAKDL